MNYEMTWFILVGVLIAGYAILDGFDLGAGLITQLVGRSDSDRGVIRSSIGPVWDGNEVWLVCAGGALFAAFPRAYAMAFGGFYMAIMLVLFGLIIRAVSLEFRHRDPTWARAWDTCFALGSLLPALLLGVAMGNVIRGVPMDAAGDFTGTFWSLLGPFQLVVGLTGLAMFVSHGSHYLVLKTDGELHDKMVRFRSRAHLVFIAMVVGATVYAVIEVSDRVSNNLDRPLGWLMIAALVGGIGLARWAIVKQRDGLAFLGSAASIAGLVGLAAVGNYPDIVPARGSDAATSLTIINASSSLLTLQVMLIVAVMFLPMVIAYTIWVYRTFRGKIPAGEAQY